MVELSTSFEDAWGRFQELDALPDEGEGWVPAEGRAQMLAFVIRVEHRPVRAYAASIVERISEIAGVEPTPEEFWHITVKAAGFQVIKRTRNDDILRQDVGRLGREAGAILAEFPAYEAQIGLPNAFGGGVFLEIFDHGETAKLNAALSGHDLTANYPIDGQHFLPHISIAGITSNEGLSDARRVLTELRAQGPGATFTIGRVELVRAWLTEDQPDLETLASCSLAAS